MIKHILFVESTITEINRTECLRQYRMSQRLPNASDRMPQAVQSASDRMPQTVPNASNSTQCFIDYKMPQIGQNASDS